MIAVISLFVILIISSIVTRIATVILVHTGLSEDAAKFQARSAFSGVGFTTSESESIVNHPVRRRVAMTLMVLGNAGIVSAIASLLLTFINSNSTPYRFVVLPIGLLALWLLARSKWVDRWLSRLISYCLNRWTDLDVRDYASLLRLADGHEIMELTVQPGDWLAGKTLKELALTDEGVVVLGIRRADGFYLGAPHGRTKIEEGDTLTVYGRADVLKQLDTRRAGAAGDDEHRKSVEYQREIVQKQDDEDEKRAREAPPS